MHATKTQRPMRLGHLALNFHPHIWLDHGLDFTLRGEGRRAKCAGCRHCDREHPCSDSCLIGNSSMGHLPISLRASTGRCACHGCIAPARGQRSFNPQSATNCPTCAVCSDHFDAPLVTGSPSSLCFLRRILVPRILCPTQNPLEKRWDTPDTR